MRGAEQGPAITLLSDHVTEALVEGGYETLEESRGVCGALVLLLLSWRKRPLAANPRKSGV